MIKMYQYNPLSLNYIRLLRILPGAEEDQISCELSQHSLDDLPEYSALSYTWGDEPASEVILLDGEMFATRPNLHAALKEFRRRPPSIFPEDQRERCNVVRRSYLDLTKSFLDLADDLVESNPGQILVAATLESIKAAGAIMDQIKALYDQADAFFRVVSTKKRAD